MSDLLALGEDPQDVLNLSSLPVLSVPPMSGDPSALTKIPEEENVLEWAGRYTSVEALREHFGTNQNKVWGDLQASTARRLYKTLLPRVGKLNKRS